MGTTGAGPLADSPLGDPDGRARAETARRLVPDHSASTSLNRLAELAATLLDAPSAQISLLADVQHIAGGHGLEEGAIGSQCPPEESLCTVTVAGRAPLQVEDAPSDSRVNSLPPVLDGHVASYLGVPLTTEAGHEIGALCVFGPEPQVWSARDVELLLRLAAPVVAELELAALSLEYDTTRLAWQLAVDAAGVGAFDWNLTTHRMQWDDRLLELFGYDHESFSSHIDDFNRRLHPDDVPRVTAALQQSIESCGEYAAEYRVVWPDGSVRWIAARGRALAGEHGTAERVVGAAYDTTEVHLVETRISRHLEAMSTPFLSLDAAWRLGFVNSAAERMLAADRDQLLGQPLWDHLPPALRRDFEERCRAASLAGEPTTFDVEFPAPVDAWFEVRAWPSIDGLSVSFLDVTERRRAAALLARAARRAEVLSRVSGELTGSLEAEESVARLTQALVPDFGDWCSVTLLDEQPHPDPRERLRSLGCWHVDPTMQPVLERYTELGIAQLRDSELVREGLSDTATTMVIDDPGELLDEVLPPGEARDLLEQLGPGPSVSLPLRGRGKLIGLLGVTRRRGSPVFDEQDVSTLEEIAARAGLALDNALLFGRQRDLVEGLQRSLLTDPPAMPGVDVIVRYQPAAEAAQVGGDWYDAFRLPDGDLALVIGDVIGHDTAAAAAMGQLRSLLRGIAVHSNDGPSDVLRGVDRAMETLQITSTATVVLARLQPFERDDGTGAYRFTWSNAGHPPPYVVVPGEPAAELAAGGNNLLLGMDAEAGRSQLSLNLTRGATVLLYTDGLVERRDQPLEDGVRLLRHTLDELVGETPDLEHLCDELLRRLVPRRGEDDVALVAVRLG